jgi:predicted DNA-binding transcriptional regulator AlpA
MYNGEEIVQITILALPKEVLDQSIVYEELREAVSSTIENCPNQVHIKDLMEWSDQEYEEWYNEKYGEEE